MSNVTLVFNDEDDTLGHLLKMNFLNEDSVSFSAYKIQHPLKKCVEVRVIASVPVVDLLEEVKEKITQEIGDFSEAFETAVAAFNEMSND